MRIRHANTPTIKDATGALVTGVHNTAGTVRCMKCHSMASAAVSADGRKVVQCPTCKSQYILTKM